MYQLISVKLNDPLTSPLENAAHFLHTDSTSYQCSLFTPDNIKAVLFSQAMTGIKFSWHMYVYCNHEWQLF
jgi:hypothetical protein